MLANTRDEYERRIRQSICPAMELDATTVKAWLNEVAQEALTLP